MSAHETYRANRAQARRDEIKTTIDEQVCRNFGNRLSGYVLIAYSEDGDSFMWWDSNLGPGIEEQVHKAASKAASRHNAQG